MMRLLLRGLSAMKLAHTVKAIQQRCSERASEILTTAAIASVLLFFVAVGVIFMLIAAYQALSTIWEPYWSALTVAASVIAFAGLVWLIAAVIRKSRKKAASPPPSSSPPGSGTDWSQMMETAQVTQTVETWIRQHPGLAVGVAIGSGVLVGLMSKRNPDKEDE